MKAEKKREGINKALHDMIGAIGLSMAERHKAIAKITQSLDLTYVFYSIDDDEKKNWVKALLRGDF